MEYQEIEQLIQAMSKGQLTRLVFKNQEFEITLEKELQVAAAPVQLARQAPLQEQEPVKKEATTYITSPMVGVFYAASSPEDPSFVSIGDVVAEDKIVCIIEAMKVMNEVKAQLKGKIVEILVKNGEPVEFGTKLFRVV